MKITAYLTYGLWVILAVLSKILLGASWWVALSPLWLPLAIVVTLLLGLQVSVDIGRTLKMRQRKADPDTCENCLFNKTAQFDKKEQCLGEHLDENIKRPHKCKFYQRHNGK